MIAFFLSASIFHFFQPAIDLVTSSLELNALRVRGITINFSITTDVYSPVTTQVIVNITLCICYFNFVVQASLRNTYPFFAVMQLSVYVFFYSATLSTFTVLLLFQIILINNVTLLLLLTTPHSYITRILFYSSNYFFEWSNYEKIAKHGIN